MSRARRPFVLSLFILLLLALLVPGVYAQQGQAGTTLSTTITAQGQGGGGAQWRIEKVVSPGSWALFQGESGTSQYTVNVFKESTAGSGPASVQGQICASNGGERPTEGFQIVLLIEYKNASGAFQPLMTAPVSVDSKPVLGPGETGCYGYSVPFEPVAGAVYRAVSLVTITNHSGYLGKAFGPETKADFRLDAAASGPSSVTVVDTNGQSWSFSDSGSVSYEHIFTCGAGGGTQQYDNTVTIQETGQSASASVTVACYGLSVSQAVTGTAHSTAEWAIEKGVVPAAWDLYFGDSGTSRYTITATQIGGGTVTGASANGIITINNPAPVNAVLNGVGAALSPDIYPAVNCNVAFPYTLGPGQSLTCTFAADLPDAAPRTSAVTVKQQAHAHHYAGGAVPLAEVSYTSQADVAFAPGSGTGVSGPITVVDSNGMSWEFAESGSVSYDQTFTCGQGSRVVENVATIQQTGASDNASVTINCHQLQVVTDASTSTDGTATWDIEKTVYPEYWDLTRGDNGISHYTITVTKHLEGGSGWHVSGSVHITNPGPYGAVIEGVATTISPDIDTSLDCGVSFPHTLGPGQSLTCTYAASLPDGATRTSLTRVTARTFAYDANGGAIPTSTVDYHGEALVEFDAASGGSVTVEDSNGMSWEFSESGTVSYDQTFTCDGSTRHFEHDNTATIVQTGAWDNAWVVVDCHEFNLNPSAWAVVRYGPNWSIEKTVSPDTWDLIVGDTGTSGYTISVTKGDDGDAETPGMEGDIFISNTTRVPFVLTGVSVTADPGIPASVDCGVTFPYQLNPWGTLLCSFSGAVPDYNTRTIQATVHAQTYTYDPDGNIINTGTTDYTASTELDFGYYDYVETDDAITVVDSNGISWEFSDSGAVTYEQTFDCAHGAGSYAFDNTATIEQTGQSATAVIGINCFNPAISQQSYPLIRRGYTWTIGKAADQMALTLAENEVMPVHYTVTLDAAASGTDWVEGTLWLHNAAPIDATIADVAGLVGPGTSFALDCGVTYPYTLGSGADLVCTYSFELPETLDGADRITVTLANADYAADGTVSPGGQTEIAINLPLSFGAVTPAETDRCVTVTDSVTGELGTVCYAADALPATFDYTVDLGGYATCGRYSVENVASYLAQDTGASGDASWNVDVTVPCAPPPPPTGNSCTRTIGYWKNHAGLGPQDDVLSQHLPIWLGEPGANNSVFVDHAAQAVKILKRSESSNGIEKLYAQMLAAKLNIASGADPAVVTATLNAADAFLATHDIKSWDKLSNAERQTVLAWKTTLDDYNNGLIGPAHCD